MDTFTSNFGFSNTLDREAWKVTVHGVAEGWTWLSDFTFTFHFHALEKEMATHSSVLAWRIPGTGKPGGLPSMGSQSRTQLKRLSSSSRTLKNIWKFLIPLFYSTNTIWYPLLNIFRTPLWNIPILNHNVNCNTCAFYSYFPFHVLKIYTFPQHIRENVTFPVHWIYGKISLFSRQQGIYEDKAAQKPSEMSTGAASQIGITFCIIIPYQRQTRWRVSRFQT